MGAAPCQAGFGHVAWTNIPFLCVKDSWSQRWHLSSLLSVIPNKESRGDILVVPCAEDLGQSTPHKSMARCQLQKGLEEL